MKREKRFLRRPKKCCKYVCSVQLVITDGNASEEYVNSAQVSTNECGVKGSIKRCIAAVVFV